MITMVVDHVGMVFLGDAVAARCIGRFAFPIYAFLLAEGYRHIRHDSERTFRHLGSYIIIALISEFCYDLMEYDTLEPASTVGSQSAMITLLLGFLGLIAIDKWKNKPLYMWSTILLTALMSYLAQSNYKLAGVLIIYAFYVYLNAAENKSWISRFLCLELIFILYLPLYHWARYNFGTLSVFMETLTFTNKCWYSMYFLVPFLLASYNEQLGPRYPAFRKVYKSFYPAHMFVIGVLRHLM